MKKVDYGSHACRPGKIAVRYKIQFCDKYLLRREKTNEIGIAIGS